MQVRETLTDTFNKVLLLEDNPGDARLVELLLMESDLFDCEIENKITLQAGIDALSEKTYAAVLLDLTLPDSRGFETLDKLLSSHPKTNVIVLTGLSDKQMGIQAVQTGAQDFLVKGEFDSDTLAKTLRYSIERNRVLTRLEEAQRIAHIGNWDFNFLTQEFNASDEIYRIFGYIPRETVFLAEHLTNSRSHLHAFHEIHQEAKAKGTIRRDVTIKDADGRAKYIFVQCSVLYSVDNVPLSASGIIQNITDRKMAEAEQQKSQQRYEAIFNQSKDGIYICSLGGLMMERNSATNTLLSLDSESQSINIFDVLATTPSGLMLTKKIKLEATIKDEGFEFIKQNGDKRYYITTLTPIDTDEFKGFNGIIRDVTEQKLAEELRKQKDLAQRASAMKEQFLASVSHEMRTPMNAILGMSHLVLKTDLNEEQNHYLSSIRQSSENLLGIINDILEISTLQNGKVIFETGDFDLHEVLENLVNVIQHKLEEKPIAFKLDIDKDVNKYLTGDRKRLNQILVNLVGNAIKFTDKGKISVRVKRTEETKDSVKLRFEVEDTGIGIPADKLQAVFETFTRIRYKERIFEGTGLGLSLVKNFVEQQDGKVGVDSIEGKGSTFFFELEFKKGNNPLLIQETNTEDSDSLKAAKERHIDLLLVEDHKMNQIVARKTIEKEFSDITVKIADNGQIAVDLIKEHHFDIVLMDIQMPVMNGYEATEYIRNEMEAPLCNLPILAMTAHAHISKDEKFKEFGMDDFVLKPFDPKQLFQKIAKYALKGKK